MARRLTHRERFRRLMHFQTVDRGIHHEFGFLKETFDRWHQEGLPRELDSIPAVEGWFGRDPVRNVPVTLSLRPGFEIEVLEEKEDTVIKRRHDGSIVEEQKNTQTTIPHYLKFPIESRRDWEAFRERLDPDDPARHQWDYAALADELNQGDVPVGINCGSYLGWIRNWVGFEQLAVMAYDDRALVAEMVEHLADLFYRMLEPALRHIEVDYAAGWEDICFNTGPLFGPNLFSEIVIPPMKRVMRLLRQHGVDVIYTDCDGNVNALLPLWLDAGMNGMFPCEVNGGSDPVPMRAKYGHDVLLLGGVAKKPLGGTRQDILNELKRLAPLVEDGGFIPMVDHRCPEYVSFENYRYYQREKLAMLGFRQDELAQIEPLRDMDATLPVCGGVITG